MKHPRPADIQTYPQFKAAMKDLRFSFSMYYGLDVMISQHPDSTLEGDDLRISEYRLRWLEEKK